MAYIQRKNTNQRITGHKINDESSPEDEKSLHLTSAKTPRMTFAGQIVIAKCVNVYDGDTAQFVWWVGPNDTGKHYRFTCRMAGYNSAEIRGASEVEQVFAQKNKQALSDKIINKIVRLDLGNYDKYGRILVTVTFEGVSLQPVDMIENETVNDWMIRSKNGCVYSGSGEKKWMDTSFL